MRVAVTATGPDLESAVDPRFGRAEYFVFVDTESMELEVLENPNKVLGGGAGIQSAQFLAGKGASAVLTGNCGPNAYAALEAAGVKVYIGVSGTVKSAVEGFKTGSFSSIAGPNVSTGFGTGGAGAGLGMGRGMGRGMGGGRGIRRVGPVAPAGAGRTDELAMLKGQAEALEQQLREIRDRIDQLGEGQGQPKD